MRNARNIFSRARLEADGSAPLYARLKRLVSEAVLAGEVLEGDAIPGERDVASMLDVSRVTVRKAFAELVVEGVLTQRHGSGTYVGQPRKRMEQPLSRLTSFTEDMRSRGLSTNADWIDRSLGLPSPEEALKLALSPGEKVCRFHRLRRADGYPMALEKAVIPQSYLPDPMAVGDSLYNALKERGHKPVRALQRLHAVALQQPEARLLGLPTGSPALSIERIAYLADGSVVELTRSQYRGESYDFVAELRLVGGE